MDFNHDTYMNKEVTAFICNMTEPISEEEYALFKAIFESLDAIERITNTSMFVIDFVKNKLIYRTKELIFTDEATQDDIKRECPNPYWALIHEEDLQLLLETKAAYLEFVKKLNPTQKLSYTYVIDYKISLHKRDHMITQKFTPLKLQPNGELWLGLFCITSSTNHNSKHIAIFGDNFRYTYNFEHNKFLPFDENMKLNQMEKAILLRAAKGFTTKQIAHDLCRSANTIKTHKARIFNKLHVSSINEAMTFIYNYRLFKSKSI